MFRVAAMCLLVACGSSKDDCRTAFDDYVRTWHAAYDEDAAALNDPEMAKVMRMAGDKVTGDDLPTRDEVRVLHRTHDLGDRDGTSSKPGSKWLAAWPAAEHAIDVCGEGAHRPQP